MMRLGISAEITHTSPEEWEEKVKQLQSTCVVFPVDYHTDLRTIDQYVDITRENDWVIGEVGAWCSPLADDENIRQKSMEKCIEQLRLADYVGARCCVNITGAAGARWDGAYRENFDETLYEKIVLSIQKIIDEAKPKKTFYTIEPMPWMIPTGPDEYVKLIRDVGRDKLKVHMDLINWMSSFDRFFAPEHFIDEVYEKLGEKIISCHLKDVRLLDQFTFMVQEVACGEGCLDLEYYVRKMLEINPDMTFYIEHLKSENEYPDSMKYVINRMRQAGIM